MNYITKKEIKWKVKWTLSCASVEPQWSPTRNVGGGTDADFLYAVFEWLRKWWRLLSIQAWQVQEFREPSLCSVVLSVLVLAPHAVWLAILTDRSMAQTSNEETDWMWVHMYNILKNWSGAGEYGCNIVERVGDRQTKVEYCISEESYKKYQQVKWKM